MTIDAIRKQLAKFDRLEAEAANAVKACEARISEGRANGLVLLNEITTYFHGCETRRPGFTYTEAHARQLTRDFAQKLLDEPYVIVPVEGMGNVPARGILVEDHRDVLLLDQLIVAREAARQAAREYRAAHREELGEDEQRRRMVRYRAALEGDSPTELLEAQRALGVLPNDSAMTSADL